MLLGLCDECNGSGVARLRGKDRRCERCEGAGVPVHVAEDMARELVVWERELVQQREVKPCL